MEDSMALAPASIVVTKSQTWLADDAELASSLLNSNAVCRASDTESVSAPICAVADCIESMIAAMAAEISSAECWA